MIGAEKAARVLSKALTGDIVVIKGKVHRRREIVTYGPDLTPTGRLRKHTGEVLEPVDLELHVNPVGLGLGALAIGGAAFAAMLAWEGITLQGPLGGEVQVIKGLKDSGLGEDLSTFYETWKAKRQAAFEAQKAQEAVQRAIDAGQIDPDLFSSETCTMLQALYNAETNPIMLSSFIREAQKLRCEWAAGLNP